MPGGATYNGADKAADAITGRATVTASTRYLMLLTVIPTAGTTPATATEYAATGYARQAAAFAVAAGTPRVIANSSQVAFGPITGANGSTSIVGWLLVDSASGTSGAAYLWGTLDSGGTPTPRTPAAGDSLTFAAGALAATVGS